MLARGNVRPFSSSAHRWLMARPEPSARDHRHDVLAAGGRRRDRAGAPRAAAARRRPPLRGVPGVGRAPARARGRQAAASASRSATSRARGPRRRGRAAGRALAHPLLLRAFGAVLSGPRPQLVLEQIEGPRLSTLIRRYGLALEQVLPLGLDVARLLRYLHAERVLHLDVKPSNIIMDGRPAADRPERGQAHRRSGHALGAGRDGSVHGAGAVRRRPVRPARAGRRRLGARRHAVRGAGGRATVRARRRALPAAAPPPAPLAAQGAAARWPRSCSAASRRSRRSVPPWPRSSRRCRRSSTSSRRRA